MKKLRKLIVTDDRLGPDERLDEANEQEGTRPAMEMVKDLV